MHISYHSPNLPLAPLVSVYGTFRGGGTEHVLTLPSLLAQVHINLGDSGFYAFADGRITPMPTVALCGPFNAAFRFCAPADFRFVTVGLLASGWHALAHLPAIDLADTAIDGACIWEPSRIAALRDALADHPLDGSHIPIVEQFLLSSRTWGKTPPNPAAAIIDRWLEHSPDLALETLAEDLDVSHRQVSRLTRTLHGASPKLLAMKYRALRAAAELAIHGENALETAVEAYSDQSHLIRDFRRFVGSTPRNFLNDHAAMARLTIKARWDAGARRPLALWS